MTVQTRYEQPATVHPADPVRACRACPNSTANPAVHLSGGGLCQWCDAYATWFDRGQLDREVDMLRLLVGSGRGRNDALFGLSGGKDSTAALARALELGFRPLAFTFDTGYYPAHIVPRAHRAAVLAGVDHVVIDLREYLRSSDVESFRLTADLFDAEESAQLAVRFRRAYLLNRQRYSVRHAEAMAYVRTCQLCRRLVVRAYHREAVARGVKVVLLGTNEWVGLSQQPGSGHYQFSAIRQLRPDACGPSVYVVHLPFLLGANLADTARVLDRIGWTPPEQEHLVEANANSCLLSRAAEAKATRMLGFHPDTTRLGREVTVGFLTREQAVAALSVVHEHPRSVRQVLADAGLPV
jgi:hypothetical protein